MVKTISFAFGVWLVASGAWAADFQAERQQNWHQWRGPEANGVAPHGNPPLEWNEQTNIQWKVEIPGKGSASPIVWGDRVFLLSAIETERKGEAAPAPPAEPAAAPQQGQRRGGGRGRGPGRGRGRGGFSLGGPPPTVYHQFVILCLDRHTGDVLWQKTANEAVPHEGHHGTNTYASGSPTTDGQFLYASFGSYGIYCYDLDGNFKWERDFGPMRSRLRFGEGTSPTLHGNSLVVNWDHEGQSFIAVLDATTGKTRWQEDRDEHSTWATPLVVEHAGRTQVVTSAQNRVRSYDLESGELIWECGGLGTNPIASPVTRDGLVYCMTGHRSYALYAIPLDATGDITGSSTIAWQKNDGTPYVSSPILFGNLLYTTKGRDAILSCWDATSGEMFFTNERLPGLRVLYASPVGAGDRIYYTGRNGTTIVVKGGTEFEVLATNKLDEGIDASPAIVGNQMLVRGVKHLYSIVAEKAASE